MVKINFPEQGRLFADTVDGISVCYVTIRQAEIGWNLIINHKHMGEEFGACENRTYSMLSIQELCDVLYAECFPMSGKWYIRDGRCWPKTD